MKKEDLIQEFETNVIQITNKCLTKLENSDANKRLEVFGEFQKSVADETPKIIQKAIINNIDDRINIINNLAEISVKYAIELKLKIQ